jgi:hypothetical protein
MTERSTDDVSDALGRPFRQANSREYVEHLRAVYYMAGMPQAVAPLLRFTYRRSCTLDHTLSCRGGGLILITADRQGVFGLTRQGHLRLQVAVRRRCGLATGDWVLLAAEPGDGLLVMHPLAALDAMITQFHAAVSTRTGPAGSSSS